MKYLSTVKHNGTYFKAGEDVAKDEFSKVELQALVDSGAVGEDKASKTEEAKSEGTTDTTENQDYDKMNKTQLLALAQERGVAVEETMTKAEIVEALSA